MAIGDTSNASVATPAYKLKSVGSNIGSFYAYGAQVEAGTYPTSYIPTYGTSATRAADNCSKTGASDVIGQTEGTLFMDFVLDSIDGVLDFRYQVSNGSSSDEWIFIGMTNSKLRAFAKNTNVSFDSGLINATVGARYKLALAYNVNDFAFYINGEQEITGGSGAVPATNKITIGNIPASAAMVVKSSVNQATLFKERLTNAELATLTTL